MKLSGNDQIKLGAILSYGVIIVNIGLGLLYTPWMVRTLGKDNYSLYTLVASFLNYFIIDFGLWKAINKIMSLRRAQGDVDAQRLLMGMTAKIYLCLDVLVCIGVIVAYFFIDQIFGKSMTAQELHNFKGAYMIAAAFGVLSFPFAYVKGVYSAYEYFVENKIFDFSVKIGIVVCTIIGLMLHGGLNAFVFIYGCVPLIVNLSRVFVLRKRGIVWDFERFEISVAKEIFSLSGWLFITVLASLFVINFSPTLIVIFSNVEDVAVFSIGIVIFGYVVALANSLSGLFVPRVTKLYVEGKDEEISRLSVTVARVQLLLVGFVMTAVVVTGKSFILAWMGEGFEESYVVCVCLMIPAMFSQMQQVEVTHMMVIDKVRYETYCNIGTAISSVLLSCLLIPHFGASGAGIGIGLSNLLFMVVLMNVYFRMHIKITLKPLIKSVSPILIALMIVGSLFYFIVRPRILSLHYGAWSSFILQGLSVCAIYSVFLPFVLNDKEKSIVKNLLYRIVGHNTHKSKLSKDMPMYKIIKNGKTVSEHNTEAEAIQALKRIAAKILGQPHNTPYRWCSDDDFEALLTNSDFSNNEFCQELLRQYIGEGYYGLDGKPIYIVGTTKLELNKDTYEIVGC